LYCHGEHLGVELRNAIESVMSLCTQQIITDVLTGKIKDGFGISRALASLEQHLKKEIIARIRTATLPDGEGEEEWAD